MSARKGQKRPRVSDESQEEDLHLSDDEGTYVDNIYIPPPIKRQNIQSSNTRLMITHITNHFFKSYAENVILGPFCKCFNAIIGPNGSGKSNVIDSMLFVFGYRATKLRCKKLSVLLHNSENYSNIQSCTVAVHFCEIIDRPGKDYEIVPGSQFVVARTANKDNSSFYEINGKKVQFKEVAKLLKHHGIDLDTNRFLILQGEVEEIALMKCKGESENETGMLEYLENVIGTDRYKKTLVQLNERVENLCDLRTEKLNRFKIVEGELQELKGPMEQAFEFLKSENKIAICKNFLYQKEIYDLEENGKEVEEEKAKMEEDRNALIAELNNIVQEKNEKENVLKREASKYEHLQQKKERFKEAFNTADKKDVQLQAEMTQTNTNRKKFKKQLEEEKKKFEKLQKVPEENEKLIEECEASKEKLTSKKEELEKEKTALLATVREQSKDLQAKKEKLETELGKLKKKVDETKTEFDLASTKLNIAQSNEVEEKQKMQNIRETIANNNTTIKQRTEEVTQLKKKIPLTEKSLSEAQKELNGVKVEEAQILNEIKSQQMNLEETRASMQSTKSQNRVLDVLMGQKREGKCPGLYGRLGDLGAIDLKYDVAISTACGPLDNLVVDTADTAEWCIEFLKKHNVGRATFIALDKQEHLRQHANTRIKTPENVHRLFDLIQVQDERVKTAFYFALRNTLVADNLDQATRIAYGAQRFRVVTLKGDIIEISGTMSGGGKTVSRGRMGQSVRTATVSPQEMQKMEENLEQKKEHVRALLQKRTSLENQIRALEPELNQMKFNFEKFRQDLQELKEQQPLLQQQLQKQESVAKSTKSNPEEVKKLTKIVEDKRTAYEKACATAEELQQEVDKLTGAIREKTVGKMRPVEKKLEETTKLLNKTKEEITRLRVAITTSDRDIKKSADKIKNFEQKITECENKLRTMQEKRSEIEDEAKKLLQCIEEVAEQLSEGIDENQTLKNEVKALADQEKKLLLKKVDVDQKFKEIKAKVDDVKGSLHQLHAKLKQLKLHIVPDEPTELKEYTIEELQSTNSQVMNLELQAAQNFIKSTTPNLNVIKEYRAAETVYMERAKELEEVTQKRNEMKNLFDKVKNQRRDEFMEAYNIIRLKLKEMYQMITLGGDADFEILDPCDPFADGVQLNVRPPRKSWKVISNLSGGEKTLASLALVFALHYYKPSPLYVMDEIDAALDFKNVSIVANYIKERTKNTQFIIISLRENMFELCDNLIGIYKVFNCTRTITVDPHAFDDNKNEKQQANGDQCVPNAETINQSEPGVSQISV